MSAQAISVSQPRRLPLRTFMLIMGTAVALLGFFWLVSPNPKSEAVVLSAPNFSLPSVDGTGAASFANTSGKPTVVNFFSSWCVPCRQELPMFAEAAKTNEGIAFYGVDHKDSRSHARDLLTASGVQYPSGYDPKGTVAASYKITTGLPATVFIDKNGHITHTIYGTVSEQELATELEKLGGR